MSGFENMSEKARREKAAELLHEAARVLENEHPEDAAERAAWRAATAIALLWPDLDLSERDRVLEKMPPLE